MGDKAKIEWTEASWNPIRGCSKVSAGCTHCYAQGMAARFSGSGQPYEGLITEGRWNGSVRLVPEHMDDPLRWKRPRRIFVNSMSDLFHDSLAFEDIAAIFGVMAASPRHSFQVLTKRAARMVQFFEWIKAKGEEKNPFDGTRIGERMAVLMAKFDMVNREERHGPWPLPNVWIGVSVENQASANERIPQLLQVPAAVRWLSCEPLLGPVDLSPEYLTLRCGGRYPFPNLPDQHRTHLLDMLDWVVVGGESGPHARPMHPDWARGLRDQCAAAGVPFLFKQRGEWSWTEDMDLPGQDYEEAHHRGGITLWPDGRSCRLERGTCADGSVELLRVGKHEAGRLLDGRLHDGYPITKTEASA